jgi:hypothetical protein
MSTRINVMLPDDLLDQLREFVPERKRSEFIAQATRDRLRRERQRQAFIEAAGSWNEPSQARFDTEEGIRDYLEEVRQPGVERRKRLWEEG